MAVLPNQANQLGELAKLAGAAQTKANETARLAASQVATPQPPTIIIQTPKG